jgi:hypothetical protein
MIQKKERPVSLTGKTYKIPSGHGTLYVTVNWDQNGEMFEVFGNLGKGGSCQRAEMEEIARLCSLALRSGISVDELIDQLRGIQCSEQIWHDGRRVTSVGDALARVLEWARAEGPPTPPRDGGQPAPVDGDDSDEGGEQVVPAVETKEPEDEALVAVMR